MYGTVQCVSFMQYASCVVPNEVHQKSLIIASLAKVLVTPPIKSSRRKTDESHRRFLAFHGMSYATENTIRANRCSYKTES